MLPDGCPSHAGKKHSDFSIFQGHGVLAWNSGAGSLSGPTSQGPEDTCTEGSPVTPSWDLDTPQSLLWFLLPMKPQVSAQMYSFRKPSSVMVYPRRLDIVPCAVYSRTLLSLCKTESLLYSRDWYNIVNQLHLNKKKKRKPSSQGFPGKQPLPPASIPEARAGSEAQTSTSSPPASQTALLDGTVCVVEWRDVR